MQQIQQLRKENKELKAIIQYKGGASNNLTTTDRRSQLSMKSLHSVDNSQIPVQNVNHTRLSNNDHSNVFMNNSSILKSCSSITPKQETILQRGQTNSPTRTNVEIDYLQDDIYSGNNARPSQATKSARSRKSSLRSSIKRTTTKDNSLRK